MIQTEQAQDAKILDTINPENFREWNSQHIVYDQKNNLKLTYYFGHGDIYITDLRNALKRGKTCQQFSVRLNYADKNDTYSNYNFLLQKPLINIYNDLIALDWLAVNKYSGKEIVFNNRHWDVYKSELNANRVYSPFTLLEVFKPLKETPTKWTIPHALRAIINGQYDYLKCNGVYTDDYAHDNAVNYQQGQIRNNIRFAIRILENPSGWHVWNSSDGSVNISCHSFDCNEFKFKI